MKIRTLLLFFFLWFFLLFNCKRKINGLLKEEKKKKDSKAFSHKIDATLPEESEQVVYFNDILFLLTNSDRLSYNFIIQFVVK